MVLELILGERFIMPHFYDSDYLVVYAMNGQETH